MRKLFRIAAPILAATAIALGSGSTALAAATPTSASLDDSWSFEDGSMTYRFDITGKVQYLDNKLGSTVSVNQITRTTFLRDGQYVGESRSVAHLRGVFQADGTVVMQNSTHTRSTVDGEDCVYHLVLRIVDYEATVYHVKSTCGG